MRFLKSYLRGKRKTILFFLLCFAVTGAVVCLYHLPLGSILYPALLCAVLGSLFLLKNYLHEKERHRRMERLLRAGELSAEDLPLPESALEEDYRALLALLQEERLREASLASARFADLSDYYTTWAHQIKTPIASMRLRLQGEDSELSRRLSLELNRIERYVEMVLAYLRIDGDDFVFREYDLDSIIRPCLRRFSGDFIARGLSLAYTPVGKTVHTDEKWLAFVIEQLLSNALKYTREGGIEIYAEGDTVLCIRDTGIGIESEDLPRIFEKGYTGLNGRTERSSSGLGLYLCQRICQKLGHKLGVVSAPGEGSTFSIAFSEEQRIFE